MSDSIDSVGMVVAMLATEFDRVRVMDSDLRRALVTRMLEEEDFVGQALGKYELDELLRGHESYSDVIVDEQMRTVTLEAHLTADEQVLLTRHNRDVRLLFEPGVVMPHAYYWAQRIVDTDRCMRALSHYGGEILDIGGNYRSHARRSRIIHSCTLLDSAREAHRQVERDVLLRADNIGMDAIARCRVGAQKCTHQATQSMSVHAMTAIPCEDWPEIMDRHGLSYHIGVFHYDPIMLTKSEGKLDGGFMHYEVKGDDVTFHFESDGSFDYVHSWSNFKKYTAPWCQYSTRTPWAYLYDLKCVQGGVATVEIVRTLQSELGAQVEKPLFAYVSMEDQVSISTFMYDLESGLSRDEEQAFMPVTMMVDREMYEFLFMYGLANDSANPNKPMTQQQFQAMGRTYNSTRRFGDACISGKRKLSALDSYDVFDAIYHVVCRERALMSARAAALTTALISRQQIPNLSISYVSVMFPINVAGAVLVAPGRVFEYYFRQFTELWRKLLARNLKKAVVSDLDSYIPLSTVKDSNFSGYHPSAKFEYERQQGMLLLGYGESMSPEEFESAVSSLASPSIEDKNSFLGNPAGTDDASDTVVNSDAGQFKQRSFLLRRGSEDLLISDVERRDIFCDKVASVLTDEMLNVSQMPGRAGLIKEYAQVRVTGLPVKFDVKIEPDVAKLHQWYRASMVEFGVYSFDVGHGVEATLRHQASQLFPGLRPDLNNLNNLNDGQDLGVKFFECNSGSISVQGESFAAGVDPYTKKLHVISKRKDGTVGIADMSVKYLVVSNASRVFNSYLIANGVLKSLQKSYVPRFTMTLVNGIPGCGKTSEIVKAFTMSDVALCTVRDSKDDTLSRLLVKHKDTVDVDELKLRVRTLDSVIIHGFRGAGEVHTVYVDEGLLAFPGQLYCALEKLRPVAVSVYGDEHQIKVIDRSPSMGSLMHKGIQAWTSVEYRNVSHSIPADVCVLLQKLCYKRQIFTTSPVMRSLSFHSHQAASDEVYVSGSQGWDYLSVLTADKAKLLTGFNFVDGKKLLRDTVQAGAGEVIVGSGVSRVFTVHEAQGQRLNKTRIVRMNVNTAAVLNSIEHIVVAISRHYYKCEYHSMGDKDELKSVVLNVVTEEEMRKVMKPPSDEAVQRIRRIAAGK